MANDDGPRPAPSEGAAAAKAPAATTEAASARQPPPTTTTTTALETQLAKGLRLTEALTRAPGAGAAVVEAAAKAASAGDSGDASASASSSSPSALPEERNGILFLFEGDLQYALPTARRCLVDVAPAAAAAAAALTAARSQQGAEEEGKQEEEEEEGVKPETFPHKCQLSSCGQVEAAEVDAATGRSRVTQAPRFPACAKCHQARYCGREHQVEDWKAKGGHKASCGQFLFLRAVAEGKEALDKRDVVVKLLFKIRLHLGPYCVAHGDKQGRGFGFVQSNCTLEELFLLRPLGPRGQPLERRVVCHYLTWGEFVSVVLEDDFELVFAKEPLEKALAEYDPETHYVVLVKLRCGYVAVLRVPLIGAGLCRSLARDYQYDQHPEVTLNID